MVVQFIAAGWLGFILGFMVGAWWVARSRSRRVDILEHENMRLRSRLSRSVHPSSEDPS